MPAKAILKIVGKFILKKDRYEYCIKQITHA
jgi:hypothetical protein